MPRYFFHVFDESSEPDIDGSEFPDIHAAKMAAVRLCGELIQEIDGKFWGKPHWQLQVANADRKLLFTLTFSAEVHEGA